MEETAQLYEVEIKGETCLVSLPVLFKENIVKSIFEKDGGWYLGTDEGKSLDKAFAIESPEELDQAKELAREFGITLGK